MVGGRAFQHQSGFTVKSPARQNTRSTSWRIHFPLAFDCWPSPSIHIHLDLCALPVIIYSVCFATQPLLSPNINKLWSRSCTAPASWLFDLPRDPVSHFSRQITALTVLSHSQICSSRILRSAKFRLAASPVLDLHHHGSHSDSPLQRGAGQGLHCTRFPVVPRRCWRAHSSLHCQRQGARTERRSSARVPSPDRHWGDSRDSSCDSCCHAGRKWSDSNLAVSI